MRVFGFLGSPYWGYIGLMENKMETKGLIQYTIGVMENKMETRAQGTKGEGAEGSWGEGFRDFRV